MNATMADPVAAARETRGLWLGLLGVVMFAMTTPMTRLAVGPLEAPQLPPVFVTAARAVGAALLSIAYLLWVGAPRPQRRHLATLAVCAVGTVIGFPLFLALALRQVEAMHAAVVTGVLPLGTAVVAAIVLRQRPSWGFWVCAVLGCALVLVFAAVQGGGRLVAADALLLAAMACTAFGYVAGARVASDIPAQQVICWVLVIALPVTVPATVWSWPDTLQSVSWAAWGAFAYVTVFSMWLGFFAWYGGLAMGGTLRVSQVQLVQPFLSLLFAVPVLGEPLEPATVAFSLAVMAVVFIGKRMPVRTTA